MADTKISALTAATTPLAGTEVLPIVQSSTTKKVAVSDLTAGRSVSAASLSLTTTPLAVTSGGTGLATLAQGDLLYGSASNTLSALAKNTTATRYLANTGTSNNPAWAQVDLTNGVTGTLPVANGGTGTTTAFTAGSVIFAGTSGVYSQDNANFFWDDANNRLGLGTASPSRQLHLAGASTTNGIFLVNTAQTSGVDIELNSLDFRFQVRNNIPTVFLNNNAETFRIAAAGDVTVKTGNLVIGTSGKGIDFSATAGTGTSELLADYEEGTWTPTITGSGGSGATYVKQEGRYTKVGRQVTVIVDVEASAVTATGSMRIGGLPFTIVSGDPQSVGSCMTNNLNWSGGSMLTLFAPAGADYLSLYGSADDAAFTHQQCVNESQRILGTITYFV